MVSFPGVKKCGCKVDYPPLTDAEVKNVWSTSTPFVCLHGVDMEIFTFTFACMELCSWEPIICHI